MFTAVGLSGRYFMEHVRTKTRLGGLHSIHIVQHRCIQHTPVDNDISYYFVIFTMPKSVLCIKTPTYICIGWVGVSI